jgi:uncharacterized membrane protein
MFGTPGADILTSWFSVFILIALFIVGIVLWKWISDIIETHFRNNPKSKNKVNKTIDNFYSMPKTLKVIFKVLGTIIYLGICLFVIAYSN